ncbi:MAG TPA: hypothetical protein VHW74_10980 [Mycobacteriales bacterium]|nr:hypothetical protein [Mycobacteriales bacterium]
MRRRESRAMPPWSSVELTRLLMTNLVGLLLVIVSWYQVSGQVTVRDQLAWFNLGIAGVLVAVVSDGMWLLRGRRHVGMARVMVLPDVAREVGSRWSDRLAEDLENRPVASASMTRYHRPSCPLVDGKPTVATTRRAHERAGKVPCELCEP